MQMTVLTLITRSALMAQMAMEGQPQARAVGALMFSCNGRGEGLFGEADFDSRTLASFLPVPSSGFFCNGAPLLFPNCTSDSIHVGQTIGPPCSCPAPASSVTARPSSLQDVPVIASVRVRF